MFGRIIKHRLPVLPVASLLREPRVKVKDPACPVAAPTTKEGTRRSRHKRKRKRSKRHEQWTEGKKEATEVEHNNHHEHRHQGERVVRIPGGPELAVPRGVTHYRVLHGGCWYKLHVHKDTGKLRHFSVKKI